MGPMNGSGMCEAVALSKGPLVGGGHWRSRSVGKVVALGEPPLAEPRVGKVGFHAHHLARHFGLSSAQVAIPVGKEGLLVSHLAHRYAFSPHLICFLPGKSVLLSWSERACSKIFCV